MVHKHDYLHELESCTLCEWRCGANRLAGERGVCGIGYPKVATAMLHPAPPQSYTIFLAGCNFRCLNCQNWQIAHYPQSGADIRGYVDPTHLAEESLRALTSLRARVMGADRIFFSGGSPDPSLPYIEEVVNEGRKRHPMKVNYDTNGFMTEDSLGRVLDIATSITFDIKAYHDDVHRALTGAPAGPVLRNAAHIAKKAPEKLWEFRFLLIPGITSGEVTPIARFIAGIDTSLPLNILAFRPNFLLEHHPPAIQYLMERAVHEARDAGLKRVLVHGTMLEPGERHEIEPSTTYGEQGKTILGRIVQDAGCQRELRDCGTCHICQNCPVKQYQAQRST